ncbi:hypothetical protein [Tomitella biformata]|nr:hypothetical protein [Tomitella biformata]
MNSDAAEVLVDGHHTDLRLPGAPRKPISVISKDGRSYQDAH